MVRGLCVWLNRCVACERACDNLEDPVKYVGVHVEGCVPSACAWQMLIFLLVVGPENAKETQV